MPRIAQLAPHARQSKAEPIGPLWPSGGWSDEARARGVNHAWGPGTCSPCSQHGGPCTSFQKDLQMAFRRTGTLSTDPWKGQVASLVWSRSFTRGESSGVGQPSRGFRSERPSRPPLPVRRRPAPMTYAIHPREHRAQPCLRRLRVLRREFGPGLKGELIDAVVGESGLSVGS
jgi:hypothetical protein